MRSMRRSTTATVRETSIPTMWNRCRCSKAPPLRRFTVRVPPTAPSSSRRNRAASRRVLVLRFRPALRGRNRDFGPISSMNTVPATIVRARWLRICPTASLPTNIRFTPFLPSRATTERKFLRSTRAISSARRSRGSSVTCTVPTTVRRAPTRVCPTKFATGTRDFSIRG